MFSLPVPNKAGSLDFLHGDGHFELHTAHDAWDGVLNAGQPFPKTTESLADVTLSAKAKDFTFGTGSLTLGIKADGAAHHQLQLLWPGQDDALAQEYGLTIPKDHVYARVLFSAQADGALEAGFPTGPISTTVGIGAGGGASYERWLLERDDTPALEILTSLYKKLRLPGSIRDVAGIPDRGELLLVRYSGYLKLNAGVTWGYSLVGTKSLDARQLNLDLDYNLRLMAATTLGYRLNGEYQIEARQGTDPQWVRFIVRKSRDVESHLAGDFGFDGDVNLRGLPAAADEFLAKILGAHAERILELFNKTRKYSSLQELQAESGNLLTRAITRYAKDALDSVLDNTSVQDVVTRLQQVATAYAALDKRIPDLYHDFLKEVPGRSMILPAIDAITGTGRKEELASLAGTAGFPAILDLLRQLYGERLFHVFQSDDTFAEAVSLLKHAKEFITGAADAEIKQWIDTVQAEIPIDRLIKRLAGMDAAQLQGIVDEKLRDLVGQLVGKAFTSLTATDFGKLANIVHNDLELLDNFKERWYGALKKAAKESFQAKLHVAYTRARKNEKLLDVEINLAAAEGPNLAKQAATGDFAAILQDYNPKVVRINQAAFGAQLRDAMNIKLNVLGWASEGILTLVQETEHTIEPQYGGLIHVYTANTYVERKKTSGWRFKEELQAKFLVQAVGETLQHEDAAYRPYAVDVVRSMTADYDLRQRSPQTSVGRLTDYLQFAQSLGVLDREPAAYARDLAVACDNDLGAVQLTYQVRFDPGSLRSAFHFSGPTLESQARVAMRSFLLHKFAAQPLTTWFPRIAFAYASDQAYTWYRENTLTASLKAVRLPSWYTGQSSQEVGLNKDMVTLVERLYRFEDSMVKSLLRLDTQIDAITAGETVDFNKLNDAVRELTKAAGALGEYDASCFPAIIDQLINIGSGGTARRDAILLLEITPAQGKLAGKTVTRMLMSGRKNSGEIATDESAQTLHTVA